MSMKLNADAIRKEYEDLSKDEILDEVVDKVLEIERLKRKLRKYENPHTPSSKQGFDKPQAEGLTVGRKLGYKSRIAGTTRLREEPTQVIDVITNINPATSSKNIKKTGEYEEFLITDFKIEKVVTLFRCYYYKDLETGEVFMAKHPDIPNKGMFGKNVIAFTNILHFENRVPFYGVANIFTNVFDISMSTPTAMNICNRTAEQLIPEYEKLHNELKNSDVINIDETGANHNGKSEWLWGFFTPTIALFAFFKKRGGDMLEKVLGEDFKGLIGCDGWLTYKVFSKKFGILLQRCWAHLIREVKEVCKHRQELTKAYTEMKEIFDEVKKSRNIKTFKIRQKKHDELIQRLENWCNNYAHYPEMRSLIIKIRNGNDSWFTCVLHPEIEPTNNLAERGLRKFVVLQKIMGCLRNIKGQKTTQTMLTLLGTWNTRKQNTYKELRAII